MSTTRSDVERRYTLAFWVLHVAGWTLLLALSVLIEHRGEAISLLYLRWLVLVYAFGSLICIPLRHIYRRAFQRTRDFRRLVPLILIATFVATNVWHLAQASSCVALNAWGENSSDAWNSYFSRENYFYGVYFRMWPFFLWSVLYFALKISIERWEQQKRLNEAVALAQDAQIMMLRYQMNPHFLFNALNSIRAMVDEDREAAREMISDLAGFLRYSLVNSDQREVPLNVELGAVRDYLAIEKRRFEDNLDIAIDVSSAARTAMIPCFILQPLVENAVKHGSRSDHLPLRVRINCAYNEEDLTLSVANTGELRHNHDGGQSGTGTGLENVRARLQNAYPGQHRFALSEREGWVTAQIDIARPEKEKT